MTDAEQADRYCVMGNPIAHSKSPAIHMAFARQTGEAIQYDAVLVEPGGFAEAVRAFAAAGGKGLNVTVPFKEEAWALVDERGTQAQAAGAVNTISFVDHGRLRGDNTDGVGFLRDFLVNHGGRLRDRRILILGAGGAVRGILPDVLAERPRLVTIVNRTPGRAVRLVEQLGAANMNACSYADPVREPYDVVINGTSLGLSGELPPVSAAAIGASSWCYDLNYAVGGRPTAFVAWALAHHAAVAVDGLGMLVEQAAAAFHLWRGRRPDTQAVIRCLRSMNGRAGRPSPGAGTGEAG